MDLNFNPLVFAVPHIIRTLVLQYHHFTIVFSIILNNFYTLFIFMVTSSELYLGLSFSKPKLVESLLLSYTMYLFDVLQID